MAPSSRLCLICGDTLTSDAERRAHIEREHPGKRVAWRDKRPWIIEGTTETRIGSASLKRMRAAARAAGGSATRRPRKAAAPRHVAAPPMIEQPTEPGAPPYFVQDVPPHFTPAGTVVGAEGDDPAGATPDDGASRDAVRLALDQPMLAEIIRNLSVVISEWDGAGEAGHFSRIEAGQLAMLLHEPAVDAVSRYFGGNVNRFRLAMAAAVILLGKGRVHVRAIAARRARAIVDDQSDAIAAAEVAASPARPDDGSDPIAALAAAQRQWAAAPRPE